MPASIVRPVHQHDCNGCRFLSRNEFANEDVYQCDDIDLIRRHGSEEHENRALPICVVRDWKAKGDAGWTLALRLYDQSLLARRQGAR